MRVLCFERAHHGDDRAFLDAERGFFAVFDGASGTPGGARAAELVRAQVATTSEPAHAIELASRLSAADRELVPDTRAGETTAVWVHVGTRVSLASAGDSSAYRCVDGALLRETPSSSGPRLGSGRAAPVPSTFAKRGRLLLTTDGLTRATTETALHDAMQNLDLNVAFESLVKQSEQSDDDVCFLLIELA